MCDLKEELVSASVIDKLHKSGRISLESVSDDSYNFYLLKTEDERKTGIAGV